MHLSIKMKLRKFSPREGRIVFIMRSTRTHLSGYSNVEVLKLKGNRTTVKKLLTKEKTCAKVFSEHELTPILSIIALQHSR